MRILVPVLSSANGPDGVSLHAANLVRCLLQRQEVKQVDVVMGAWQQRYFNGLLDRMDGALRASKLRIHCASCSRHSLARNIWYYRKLARVARELGSDLIHLTYPVAVNRSQIDCPVVTTLHDLYPYDLPQNFGYPRVLMNRLILRHCVAMCDAIACVSKTTQARLAAHFPTQSAKATCVYNCVEPEEAAARDPVYEGAFVLMVAQHRKAKNIPLAFAIMRRLLVSNPGLALLIVGNDGPETGKIHRLLGDEPLRSRIVLLQNLTGQQLQSCYRNCELLLATSSIEGFGLPVAEAILAGAPVICSDIPAFREVGAMHCRFVRLDSFATQSFASAIREALHTKRPEAAKLPHLSSPVIAEQYMQLYLSLLSMLSARAACFPQTGRRARGIA